VQNVIPNVVKNDTYLGIYYADLIPVVIRGMQEQQGLIQNVSTATSVIQPRLVSVETEFMNYKGSNDPRIMRLEQVVDELEAFLPANSDGVQTYQEAITDLQSRMSSMELEISSLNAKYVDLSTKIYGIQTAGLSTFKDLQINGKIDLGDLIIRDGSIATTANPLRIQPDFTNSVEFMGGKFTVDTNGYLVTTGEITAAKYNVSVSDESKASIGKGTIVAGQTSAVIDTTVITEDSLVFVTATTKTKQPLTVTTKVNGESFTVEIDTAETRDISFNWWIVDQKKGQQTNGQP
jgi:hypothetical protein